MIMYKFFECKKNKGFFYSKCKSYLHRLKIEEEKDRCLYWPIYSSDYDIKNCIMILEKIIFFFNIYKRNKENYYLMRNFKRSQWKCIFYSFFNTKTYFLIHFMVKKNSQNEAKNKKSAIFLNRSFCNKINRKVFYLPALRYNWFQYNL